MKSPRHFRTCACLLVVAAAASGLAGTDAEARASLPLYLVIPAATPAAAMTTWTQSHGDMGARRYSALAQINRDNVRQLREAWNYHSGNGQGHLQSNPIVVVNASGGGKLEMPAGDAYVVFALPPS